MYCILHIIASNFFGGPEKQIVEHCASLDSGRWRMIVCSFMEGKGQNELVKRAGERGIETNILDTKSAYNPLVLLELAGLLRRTRPDVIVAHGYRALILCLVLKVYHKVPIIGYSRGYTGENPKIRMFERVHRAVLNFCNLIVAVSEGHKRLLVKYGVAAEKIKVVLNSVAVNAPQENQGVKYRKGVFERIGVTEGRLVVCAGRMSPEKGHRVLIEAISILGERARDTHFVFCGEGQCKKELKRLAEKFEVGDRCHFVGFRRDLDEIFRAMDFLVLPSLSEGLPNVVLEAFAWGKPVVATKVGGVPEVVKDGINGVLVAPNRPDLLARGIAILLASPELQTALGKAGYHNVEANFSFKKQNEKLKRIYEATLGVDNSSNPSQA